MKINLYKSILAIGLFGAAGLANATVCVSPCNLTNLATSDPTLAAGQIGLIPNTVVAHGAISGPGADWYFTLSSTSSVGGAAQAINFKVPHAGRFHVNDLDVALYNYNGGSPTLVTTGVSYRHSHSQFRDSSLAAGTYFVRVTGFANGKLGGDYAGAVAVSSVSAVPLPAAAWLFLSGIAGMGVMARRKTEELI